VPTLNKNKKNRFLRQFQQQRGTCRSDKKKDVLEEVGGFLTGGQIQKNQWNLKRVWSCRKGKKKYVGWKKMGF